MQYHTMPCNIMQYCKKYLQSTQMDAHRWEDPLAWQHCTQSTFYTNLFTFPSIITFSFTFAFNCVFTFKQRSPKVKFSLSLFFHQHRLEEEFPLKTLHAINFSPNFSLALFFPLLTYPLLRRLLRIFYSSNQSLNQSFANSQDFTHICSKEQYCLANTSKFQCCNEIFEYISSFVVVFC